MSTAQSKAALGLEETSNSVVICWWLAAYQRSYVKLYDASIPFVVIKPISKGGGEQMWITQIPMHVQVVSLLLVAFFRCPLPSS